MCARCLRCFKVLTNFEVFENNEFASFVCPIIHDNAHSTRVERVMSGKPIKLMHVECLVNIIMYLKPTMSLALNLFNRTSHASLYAMM